MIEPIMVVALAAVLATAVWTDLRSSRIPNWLTFPAMCFALAGHAWLGGPSEAIFSLEGLGAGLGLFLIPYMSKGIGAGDVKLLAAVGAIVGPYGVLLSGLLTVLVGGVYAVGAMCYQWGFAGAGRKLAGATIGFFLTGGKGLRSGLGPPVSSALWACGCGRYPTICAWASSLR